MWSTEGCVPSWGSTGHYFKARALFLVPGTKYTSAIPQFSARNDAVVPVLYVVPVTLKQSAKTIRLFVLGSSRPLPPFPRSSPPPQAALFSAAASRRVPGGRGQSLRPPLCRRARYLRHAACLSCPFLRLCVVSCRHVLHAECLLVLALEPQVAAVLVQKVPSPLGDGLPALRTPLAAPPVPVGVPVGDRGLDSVEFR